MSFRKRANGGRRDRVEPAIVEALQAFGARVWRLGGQGNPDLLCLYRKTFTPLEVKTGKSKANRNQQDLLWPIVRTPDEAIAVVTGTAAPTAPQANFRSCQ